MKEETTPNNKRSNYSQATQNFGNRSNSASKRNDTSKYMNGLCASPYSPESAMTSNPL